MYDAVRDVDEAKMTEVSDKKKRGPKARIEHVGLLKTYGSGYINVSQLDAELSKSKGDLVLKVVVEGRADGVGDHPVDGAHAVAGGRRGAPRLRRCAARCAASGLPAVPVAGSGAGGRPWRAPYRQ